MILLRLLHIMLGALWVGVVVFLPFYLMPSLADAGPDSAGKVMGGLERRRIHVILPLVALLTLVSGYALYWKASAGFRAEYMGSHTGMAFGIGGVIATLAFLVGLMVARPAMTKAAEVGQQLATASEADRPSLLAMMQRHRNRGAFAGRIVAILVLLALSAMAVARYL